MSTKSTCLTLQDTFEGLGNCECSVDVEIEIEYTSGIQPYYTGSGSYEAGWEPELCVLGIKAMSFCHRDSLNCIFREQSQGWFEILDSIVATYALTNFNYLYDQWIEDIENGC